MFGSWHTKSRARRRSAGSRLTAPISTPSDRRVDEGCLRQIDEHPLCSPVDQRLAERARQRRSRVQIDLTRNGDLNDTIAEVQRRSLHLHHRPSTTPSAGPNIAFGLIGAPVYPQASTRGCKGATRAEEIRRKPGRARRQAAAPSVEGPLADARDRRHLACRAPRAAHSYSLPAAADRRRRGRRGRAREASRPS